MLSKDNWGLCILQWVFLEVERSGGNPNPERKDTESELNDTSDG